MTIEFSDKLLYDIYCDKRESLPLYYCKYSHPFPKGMYRCEIIDGYNIRVYDTYKGVVISKFIFNQMFEKPSKIELFIYNHLYFLWL